MTVGKIEFEKHKGLMDFSDNSVIFYNLRFKNIVDVKDFFNTLKPGNYKGWVKDDKFGLINLDSGVIFTYLDK